MWARVIETVLGIWLVLSPFIFHHYQDATRAMWMIDIITGSAIIIISLASIAPSLKYLHLMHLLVGGWLIAYGYFAGGHPNMPGHQNQIFIGLTLLLFAIIPNNASDPPPDWRRYAARKGIQNRSGAAWEVIEKPQMNTDDV